VGYSNEIAILAARNPWQVAKPTTTFDRTLQVVKLDWTDPYYGGSEITGYKIFIRQDNLIYSEELVSCDGSDSTILANTECSIPVPTLLASPFSLAWGSNIYAKVVAYNSYGESEISEAGNEAIILTIPDAPVMLAEVVEMRTDNSITFTW